MRIVVVADTHGRTKNLKKVCLMQRTADVFIHLGDGIDDIDSVESQIEDGCFVAVKGNVDFSSNEPTEKLLVLESKRIFITHGHKHGVKRGYDPLVAAAKAQHADIVLFGHTHYSYSSYVDGIHILNPGSLEIPRYNDPIFGIIDIIDGQITAYLSKL
ncbi:MAG: YfcE family phosphodiesterase [Oscillospiraceae bacterium]|nr:YfcE family phosphodiesterase [Oscillospiraceae bacterium]